MDTLNGEKEKIDKKKTEMKIGVVGYVVDAFFKYNNINV